jgi:hypothetical protein
VYERGEQRLRATTKLLLQYSNLVPQGEDLEVLSGAAKQNENVRQTKVGQSQQPGRSSNRGDRVASRRSNSMSFNVI